MNGFLDPPRNLELIGWAWNPPQPELRLRVEIAVDGQALRRCTAAGYRPDLRDAGIGDGRHAFSLELPLSVFDGQPHSISATVEGEHIAGSPMQFQSQYAGGLQRIGMESIGGWLRDESRPEAPIIAEVYADGRFLGSSAATAPGETSFEVPIPVGFQTSRVLKFELYAKGSSIPIASVERRTASDQEPIDIVVNANKGFVRGLQTVESIVCSNIAHPHELLVVPSDGDFAEAWNEAAARLGFQCLDALESALLLHPEHDILLVEGDTQVGGDWLDRLHQIAYTSPATATVSMPDTLAYVRRDYLQAYISDIPGMSPLSRLYPSDYAKGYGRQHVLGDPDEIQAVNLSRSVSEPAPSQSRAGITANLRCSAGTTVWLSGDDESFLLPEQRVAFLRFCRLNNITRFRIDSIVDAPLSLFDLSIPYELAVWDFSWICPRADLIDETGRYCGEPVNIEACERCLRKLGPREGWGDLLHRSASVAEMRDQNRHILEGAQLVDFPSPDARNRIARYAPNLRAGRVAAPPPAWSPSPSSQPNRPLQTGFYGDPAVLEACRWDALKRNLPIEFVDPAKAAVTFYANTSPDMQASIETPTLAFDLGATAESMRLARLDHLLLPVHASASAINDALLKAGGVQP